MACISTVRFSVLLNGGLEGYFGSCRGLRQGDPISPYLFTLIMEVLSRLLISSSSCRDFSFHPMCKRLGLSHLMFADDVIIFSKANISSLVKLKEALRCFTDWSGLHINTSKSAIYFGGCSEQEEIALADIVNFQRGCLPFSYLGVPLHGKKLNERDFTDIVNKMTSKIKAWSAKCLSYAGRLVLVNHVLSTISSYWMRVIIFPKGVLKKINALCRNFLWSGDVSGKRNLVAWKSVCKPKSMGGLGIKNLCSFNKALMLGQLWDFYLKKDSMWIRWLNSYVIKERPIWTIEEKKHLSWIQKSLLALRADALKCIDVRDNQLWVWKTNNNQFTAKGTYNLLNCNEPLRDWCDLIWNDLAHPKHSFCAWMAVLNRLPTKDRLRGSLIEDINCCWCSNDIESVDHLFFQCSAVTPIFSYLSLIGMSIQWNSWDELIEWKQSKRWSSKAQKNLAFFIITAATYESWKARNNRIFKGNTEHADNIRRHIWRILVMKIDLLKINKTGRVYSDWLSN